jgi:hypothetical protein
MRCITPRRLDGVAGGAYAEHVVGRQDPQLFEEDVGHQPVVVLPGVDQCMAAVRPEPALRHQLRG